MVNSAYLILVSLQTTAGLFAATLVVTPRVIAQDRQLHERVAQVQQAATVKCPAVRQLLHWQF